MRIPLHPLALVLGLAIAAQVPADEPKDPFAKWEPTIKKFEEADEKSPPEPGGVLFVGSSSIRMWDTDKEFPELDVINRGFGGSTMAEVNHFAPRIVLPYKARTIAVYAGDNDVSKGLSPEEVAEDFADFVKIARGDNPDVKIIYIAIKPSVSRWKLWPKMLEANNLIAAKCEEDENLEFADIAKVTLGEDGKPDPGLFIKDGLHLNADGYAAWKTVLKPLLKD